MMTTTCSMGLLMGMNVMKDNIFDLESYVPLTPEEEEKELQKEKEAMLLCCGSCLNFISLMAEAGLCKLKPGCFCKGTGYLIDMFDAKCEEWDEKILKL